MDLEMICSALDQDTMASMLLIGIPWCRHLSNDYLYPFRFIEIEYNALYDDHFLNLVSAQSFIFVNI
jgi:hypothetical protein